ncbi:MAG: hypothetical protein K2M06_03535 [Muribaculaceae bacterium]|nr:hypothetical protein [Muribaculaceae bacterium]
MDISVKNSQGELLFVFPYKEDYTIDLPVDIPSDPAKIGIGIEYAITGSTSGGTKMEGSGIAGVVVFLGGKDAGYVYSYAGGEIGGGIEGSVGVGISVNKSIFVTYQSKGDKTDHNQFSGKYVSVGGSFKAIFGKSSLSVSKGLQEKGTDAVWTTVALSEGCEAFLGLKSPISPSISICRGKTAFLPGQDVGKPKNFAQKTYSWGKLIQLCLRK